MIDRFADAVSDRYRIERELGAGGMATVYLADDLKHERKVAIKVLRPELAAVVGGERFLSEIETTANLQHPHILPLFDSGEAGGLLFYVMPYVEGESLQDRLDRERQLPVDEAVRITTDVAEALHAAHQRGVVHRDVKPANILLSGGRPLVADFGIALALSHAGGGRLTETGLSMGTPYYMSPEQASADRDATPASDQYSLACVLYEMLVGEPPFPGGSAQAVLARILTADPTPPSELRRSVPPHLDAVVMRGLEKLPADRFPDLREMVRALRDEGHRYAAGRSRTGKRSPRRGPATLVPWTLAAVATILAGAAWLRPGPSVFPADDRRLAIPMQEDAQLPLGQLVPFGVDAGFFAVSPDARTLVHLGYDGDRVRLYRRPLNSYESTIFPGTEGAFWPFFSPDGAWVAYFASTALWKVPVTGGEPVRLADAPNPAGGVWGEDGRILFSIMEGGRLMSVSDAGGQGTLVEAEMTYEAPVQLPGGGLLVAEGPPAEVRLRTADGLWKTVLEGKRPQLLPSGHLTFVRGRTPLRAAGRPMNSAQTGASSTYPERTRTWAYPSSWTPTGSPIRLRFHVAYTGTSLSRRTSGASSPTRSRETSPSPSSTSGRVADNCSTARPPWPRASGAGLEIGWPTRAPPTAPTPLRSSFGIRPRPSRPFSPSRSTSSWFRTGPPTTDGSCSPSGRLTGGARSRSSTWRRAPSPRCCSVGMPRSGVPCSRRTETGSPTPRIARGRTRSTSCPTRRAPRPGR